MNRLAHFFTVFLEVLLQQKTRSLFLSRLLVAFLITLSINQAAAFGPSKKIDSLKSQLRIHKEENTKRVDLLNETGYAYWIVDANESIRYGKEALKLSEKIEYTQGLAKANRIVGVAYWSQGFQNKALIYLNTSFKIYHRIEDKTGVANTMLNIGMVYADLKDYEKAFNNYEAAINGFTALNLKSRIATTFTKIGSLLLEQNKNDEALQYLTDALQMHTNNDFTYGKAEVHNRLAILYLNKNEIEQAFYHVNRAMVLGDQVNDIHGLTNNLIIQGKILRLSNKLDEATTQVEKGLELALENNLKQYELLAYGELKELKKEQNKLSESMLFYDRYMNLKDSLFNSEKSKQIAFLEFENELERKDKKMLELEAKEKTDTIIKYVLIAGLTILCVIGYLIYFYSRESARKNRELAIKKQENSASIQALIQKDLENSELKRDELKRELDFKNKELTSYTINFIKKNEIVQQLQETIKEVKKSSVVDKDKLILSLKKVIRKNLSIDKDWENFSRFFEDVHEGFYTRLKLQHPDLSNNDLKLCSLIRLNLNIKETAGILGISPESVKTARYRLRKKLQLDSKEEIFTYLVKLNQK